MNERFESTKKAGILGICGNVFLLIIKATVGFICHSQAMIADSMNSAGDIFASLMTFIGNKIASVPKDADHNFGHGKAEYIFSMFISISMMFISIKLFYDALLSLINGSELIFSWSLVLVCLITIFIKILLYIYTNNQAQKYNNILLEANKEDHRNDCIVTTFTLISIILSFFHIYWLDGLVGIGISIWIFYTGINIFIESYNVLMDISIDTDTEKNILDIANTYKEILKIKEISSVPVGQEYVVFLTICVEGSTSTYDSHLLADNLEKEISHINKIYKAIVHVEPLIKA